MSESYILTHFSRKSYNSCFYRKEYNCQNKRNGNPLNDVNKSGEEGHYTTKQFHQARGEGQHTCINFPGVECLPHKGKFTELPNTIPNDPILRKICINERVKVLIEMGYTKTEESMWSQLMMIEEGEKSTGYRGKVLKKKDRFVVRLRSICGDHLTEESISVY